MSPTGPEPSFAAAIDRSRGLVRLTLVGLWNLTNVENYTASAREALQSLPAGGAPPFAIELLIDLRNHPVQSREATKRIQKNIKAALSDGARHAVLACATVLHRMQARRLASLISASFFTREADAMAWQLSFPTEPHPQEI